jgi:uncharacterized membrane protein YhaH (DUF805 family)
MNWYKKVMSQYADFKGRARRQEYWMFVLFNLLFIAAAGIIDRVTGLANEMTGIGPVYSLYVLAVFIPSIAVSIRRLHDIGKSGWWIALALLPIIGAIWLLVLMVKEGQRGENQYGADPKGISSF